MLRIYASISKKSGKGNDIFKKYSKTSTVTPQQKKKLTTAHHNSQLITYSVELINNTIKYLCE